jgi:hypothetical protein
MLFENSVKHLSMIPSILCYLKTLKMDLGVAQSAEDHAL